MSAQLQLKDTVVSINRVTKVVKGGKNLSFSALVIVGDEGGHVGHGSGKAKEVPQAIRKAIEAAKKNMIRVPLTNNTIPHQVMGLFGAGRVLLKPAKEGTGIIAGGAVRAVMQAAGVSNILTKSIGTSNPHNVIKATFEGLKSLRDPRGSGAASRQDARRDHGVIMAARKKRRQQRRSQLVGRSAKTSPEIRIQYYRSSIGFSVTQKLIVKGLGFGKLNSDAGARRYARDSRDDRKSAAPGADCGVK